MRFWADGGQGRAVAPTCRAQAMGGGGAVPGAAGGGGRGHEAAAAAGRRPAAAEAGARRSQARTAGGAPQPIQELLPGWSLVAMYILVKTSSHVEQGCVKSTIMALAQS